jgi:hypothetical protein
MEALRLNPSDLTDQQIRTLAFAIAPLIKESFTEEVLTRKEAAAHVRCGQRTFDRYVALGKFRSCDGKFFKSMLNEDLKKLLKP